MAKSKRKHKKSKTKKKNTTLYVLLAFLIIGFATVWLYFKSIPKKIDKNEFVNEIPKGFASFGIDISHHQGIVDWQELLDNQQFDTIIHFVYCKATEGIDHVDTQWSSNRDSLNNRGIPNGAYHFFSSKSAPKPQADHFLNYWKKREVDLPPVLDVETEGFSDEDLRAKMLIWLKEIEKKTGMRPLIYTSAYFFETKFKNYFPEYNFWIAAYSQKPDFLDDSRILHWQYSEDGNLPGINESVDFNVSKSSF